MGPGRLNSTRPWLVPMATLVEGAPLIPLKVPLPRHVCKKPILEREIFPVLYQSGMYSKKKPLPAQFLLGWEDGSTLEKMTVRASTSFSEVLQDDYRYH